MPRAGNQRRNRRQGIDQGRWQKSHLGALRGARGNRRHTCGPRGGNRRRRNCTGCGCGCGCRRSRRLRRRQGGRARFSGRRAPCHLSGSRCCGAVATRCEKQQRTHTQQRRQDSTSQFILICLLGKKPCYCLFRHRNPSSFHNIRYATLYYAKSPIKREKGRLQRKDSLSRHSESLHGTKFFIPTPEYL